MVPTRHFLRLLLSVFRSGRAEAELAHEIEAHLQLLQDSFVERGDGSEGKGRTLPENPE